MDSGWRNSNLLQPLQDGRKNQSVRDESCLITNGNGSSFRSLKTFKAFLAKRIFEGLEDLSLRVLG